jgi:hypothetical protein
MPSISDLTASPPDVANHEQDPVKHLLTSLTLESEFFGLLGRNDARPRSFYRVYVRTPLEGRWWCFGRSAYTPLLDPVRVHARAWRRAGRGGTPVNIVWAPLSALLAYQHHPEHDGLRQLFDRTAELVATEKIARPLR